jgi:GDPmannose 4,6-dehydratase
VKRAIITGISGQDGSYLAEHLLSLGYEVYGLIRRHSVSENQDKRLENILGNIHNFYGDLTDIFSIQNIFEKAKPDEVYNLAAMSHVKISSDMPYYTLQANSIGTLNILECMRTMAPKAKFYQASSSEMFGNSVESNGTQNELTPMNPVSPYGCSKLLSYTLVKHYRNAYGLHACNGILFNHESPRRGINFVTSKVVKTAVEIKKKLKTKLVLGNLDSFRDWGHSKDYVKAIHKITNHSISDDYVVATGKTYSVRYLCEYTFSKLGMNYSDYVVQDEKYMRPEELKYLCGDPSKLKNTFDWQPEYTFESMIDEMIEYWMNNK